MSALFVSSTDEPGVAMESSIAAATVRRMGMNSVISGLKTELLDRLVLRRVKIFSVEMAS